MNSRAYARIAAFLVVVAVSVSSFADAKHQVASGKYPFGTYGGGPDVVNLGNVSVQLSIPIFSKAGRGLPFNYTLNYDSGVWYRLTSFGDSWQPQRNFGWSIGTQQVTGSVVMSSTVYSCNDPVLGTVYYTENDYTGYYDARNVLHPLSVTIYAGDGSCVPTPQQASGFARDDSGYQLQATYSSGTTTVIVYDASGTAFYPPINSNNGSGKVVDTNGNKITTDSAGLVFTDTLNYTALSISGSPLSNLSWTNPSGGTSSITITYTSKTVLTAFGCSSISEYGPTAVNLPTTITLPDGSHYDITYEANPNNGSYTTGRIASIRYPTGGTISYTYANASSGIGWCWDGTVSTLTRTTPDGTWTYSRVQGSDIYHWTTTVTDPANNQTVIAFAQAAPDYTWYEMTKDVYTGTATGTALKHVDSLYNPPMGTVPVLPFTERKISTKFNGGSTAVRDEFYNSSGMQTELDEYDFGASTLTRKTVTTYASLGSYIAGRPATVKVYDSAGNVKKQTTYSYDQIGVTSTTGTPQHDSVSGSRGNVTTIAYLTSGSSTISKTFTYFDTGTVKTATDVNGAQTTYTYGACGNSFVTSIALPLSLSRSQAWNCTGGVLTSKTDENNQQASITYGDSYFWRPTSSTDKASNTTSYAYPDPNSFESTLSFNSGNSTVDVYSTSDGLGRSTVGQHQQSPGNSYFDSRQTKYNSMGLLSDVSVPYSGTKGQTTTGAFTSKTFDGLGRATQVTDAGGGTVSYAYSKNDVLITKGPAPTGENTKRRQLEYDGLGRLTSVCELTSGTGSGTCGQTNSQTGYWTQYIYNLLDKLTGVTQNAQGTSQTRSYTYDAMGRMTSETNPETGTINYTYDTDATCGTSNGDLVKRVDAVGNTTCYAYDALHRVTAKTYSGPYASNTPEKHFVYDQATVNGQTMANAKGRLAEAYTGASKTTDLGYSYSARGQVTDIYEKTANSGGYYHLTATYWAHGKLNQLSGLPGLPTITYGVDGHGRITSVSAGSGQNPVTAVTYDVGDHARNITLGSGDSDAFTEDSNTHRMTQYQFSVGATPQTVSGALTWSANGSLASLNITDQINSNNTQNCSYTYDDLARVASVSCGSVWAQTFTFDLFGNISKSGSASFQPTYSTSTNRITSLPGNTPTYDANGNLTSISSDNTYSFSWDAEGRPVSITAGSTTVNLTHDAMNRMIEQNRSGSYTQIVYHFAGKKLALMSGQSVQKAFVTLPGGGQAVYTASGLSYYRHRDWLGSSRFATTPARTVYYDGAYAPYGESYAETGTTDRSFTGQNQDTVAGLSDFLFREYHGAAGRWISPDPSGISSADNENPQSWNRYAYLLNGPLANVDRNGMGPCPLNDNGDLDCSDTPNGGGGGGGTCAIDGWAAPCSMASSFSAAGAIASCYYGDACWMPTSINGQWADLAASAGDAFGFVPFGAAVWDWNGQFYTSSQWATFLQQRQDAQRSSLASAIAAANPNLDYYAVYNKLQYDHTTGGNADFVYLGDVNDLSFVPGYDVGGGRWSRYGSFPSIHMDNGFVHLDTVNPSWAFPIGLLGHGLFDFLLGHINSDVPMEH